MPKENCRYKDYIITSHPIAQVCGIIGADYKSLKWPLKSGRWNRFDGARKGDKACYIRELADGAYYVGSWQTGQKALVLPDDGRAWDKERKKSAEVSVGPALEELEKERLGEGALADAVGMALWKSAHECERHSYLDRKGLSDCAHLFRHISRLEANEILRRAGPFPGHDRPQNLPPKLGDDLLVVPLKTLKGEVQRVQLIAEGKGKIFLQGPLPPDLHFDPEEKKIEDLGAVGICEGVATALSIQKLTKKHCLACLSASRLESFTCALIEAQKVSAKDVLIYADNDDVKGSRTGIDAAVKASVRWSLQDPVYPHFSEKELELFADMGGGIPSDFDDKRQLLERAGRSFDTKKDLRTWEKTRARSLERFTHVDKAGEKCVRSCGPALDVAYSLDLFGGKLRYDKATAREEIKLAGEVLWRELTDDDVEKIKGRLQKVYAFTDIKRDTMSSAVRDIALESECDSVLEHFEHLSAEKWDEVPRCQSFFSRYCGAEDSPYTRALGCLLFAAMSGRMTSPEGVKNDVVVCLVGPAGAGKSTLCRVLAGDEKHYLSMSFNDKPDERVRKCRGKTVVELEEAGSMSKKSVEERKRWCSQVDDPIRELYHERIIRVVRRYIAILTSNEKSFIEDPKTNRRFAPAQVHQIDIDAVRADLPYLLAEGLELFRTVGIGALTQEVEAHLRSGISEEYAPHDSWEEIISAYLAKEGAGKDFWTLTDLYDKALDLPVSMRTARTDHRLAQIMRDLGYEAARKRIGGRVTRGYTPLEVAK